MHTACYTIRIGHMKLHIRASHQLALVLASALLPAHKAQLARNGEK